MPQHLIRPRHDSRSAQPGDFWKLLKPEHARAEAFCRKLAANREDADDLYQDSLLTAIRNFDRLKDPGSFRTWLYRIVINQCRNHYRRPWRRRRVQMTPQLEIVNSGSDPAAVHAARRWLNRGMAILSVEQRALVCLHELEGWTIAELARLFRRPQGTIKARLSRSRKKMRREIERYLNKQEEPTTNGAAHVISQSQPSSD